MIGLLRLAHAHRAVRCAAAMGKRKGRGSRLYAVRLGRSAGVYDTWEACSQQVLGYSGAQFKSFETAAEAQFYLEGCPTLSAAAWRRHAACAPPAAAAWCSGAAGARRCTEGDQAPAAEACAPPPPAAWCPGARATGDPCSPVDPSRRYRLEWDGGARGNPGPAGAGAVLYEAGSGGEVGRVCVTLGRATNNVAEYHGLLAGLQAALDLGVRRLDVQGDSMLVVNQVLGTWQCRHPGLQPLHARAVALTQAFDDLTIAHMPRAANVVADALSNLAMDGGGWEGLRDLGGRTWLDGQLLDAPAGEPSSSADEFRGRSAKRQRYCAPRALPCSSAKPCFPLLCSATRVEAPSGATRMHG